MRETLLFAFKTGTVGPDVFKGLMYSTAGVLNECTTHATCSNDGATGAGLEHEPPTAGLGMSAHRLFAITATKPSTRSNPHARVIRQQACSTSTPPGKPFMFVLFFPNKKHFRPTCSLTRKYDRPCTHTPCRSKVRAQGDPA